MPIALTASNAPRDTDYSQKRVIVSGTAVLSGNYPTGGEPINWATLADASGVKVPLNSTTAIPDWVEFQIAQAAGGPPVNFFVCQYNYTSNTVQFAIPITAGQPMAEIAAGAYGNWATGAILRWRAEFLAE